MAAVQRDWGLYKKRRFLHRRVQSEEGVKGRGEKTAVYRPGREAWTDPALTAPEEPIQAYCRLGLRLLASSIGRQEVSAIGATRPVGLVRATQVN